MENGWLNLNHFSPFYGRIVQKPLKQVLATESFHDGLKPIKMLLNGFKIMFL